MAGRIPELKDLEAQLADCADEESCRNAFVEYGKRGGAPHGDSAAAAVRKRIKALEGSTPMETFGRDAEGHIKHESAPPGKGGKSVGQALSEGLSASKEIPSPVSTPPQEEALSPNISINITLMAEGGKHAAYITRELVRLFGSEKFWRGEPSAEEVE